MAAARGGRKSRGAKEDTDTAGGEESHETGATGKKRRSTGAPRGAAQAQKTARASPRGQFKPPAKLDATTTQRGRKDKGGGHAETGATDKKLPVQGTWRPEMQNKHPVHVEENARRFLQLLVGEDKDLNLDNVKGAVVKLKTMALQHVKGLLRKSCDAKNANPGKGKGFSSFQSQNEGGKSISQCSLAVVSLEARYWFLHASSLEDIPNDVAAYLNALGMDGKDDTGKVWELSGAGPRGHRAGGNHLNICDAFPLEATEQPFLFGSSKQEGNDTSWGVGSELTFIKAVYAGMSHNIKTTADQDVPVWPAEGQVVRKVAGGLRPTPLGAAILTNLCKDDEHSRAVCKILDKNYTTGSAGHTHEDRTPGNVAFLVKVANRLKYTRNKKVAPWIRGLLQKSADDPDWEKDPAAFVSQFILNKEWCAVMSCWLDAFALYASGNQERSHYVPLLKACNEASKRTNLPWGTTTTLKPARPESNPMGDPVLAAINLAKAKGQPGDALFDAVAGGAEVFRILTQFHTDRAGMTPGMESMVHVLLKLWALGVKAVKPEFKDEVDDMVTALVQHSPREHLDGAASLDLLTTPASLENIPVLSV